ncbi:hypothetical protein F7725_018337 [Dissostichus mawsoni]|uniref:Rap-GAP domain-containing protein n=1 Tax=Dissostichus mawsoni TaxID=36200 RepID=A0A7J5XRB7_DISMA|nr:hypothetical protein F7725_018337 [Dissostichus mawsoni]
MEREKRNDMSFSRKRSFTFGAYGGSSHFLVYSVDRFTCGDETRPETAEENLLDSPAGDRKPFLPASSNQRDTELFEIIEKLQGSRIDEQRCEFPLPLKLLTIGADLPLILPPKLGGYWVDPPLQRLVDVSPTSSHYGFVPECYDIMERDREAKIYHKFFRSRYHHSFTAVDPALGPLVLSVCLEEEESKLRLFSLPLIPQAPELITTFDEHRVSPNFKFGVLYQKDRQLQRKRHIGNDIVALVYQEGQSPFLSDVIKSHFLHCFVVVRRIKRVEDTSETAYEVSVTAREDVPPFGPVLPDPPIFTDRALLREFLLTKLINAEISCYKAQQFSRLELRTRSLLLESLHAELCTRSQCMMGDPSIASLPSSEGPRVVSEGSGGFIENFKRAIRVRSHSFETLGVPRKIGGSASQRPKTEKDGEGDRSPGPLPADSLGPSEIKDQASPQEDT